MAFYNDGVEIEVGDSVEVSGLKKGEGLFYSNGATGTIIEIDNDPPGPMLLVAFRDGEYNPDSDGTWWVDVFNVCLAPDL